MDSQQLVKTWFTKWESGDYLDLPIAESFTHTSPFGTIEGKQAYLDLVKANQDKFLGYRFELLDGIYGPDKACVRYTGMQGDFRLDVSEWYVIADGLIQSIISYYKMEGEIPEDRQLSKPVN